MQSAAATNTAKVEGPTSGQPASWRVVVAVTVPGLLFMIGCFNALPYVDPIRDAYQGWLIAHDGHLPLIGPPLAGAIHLGPLWFYLMAVPAMFASSMLAFSLLVGALGATKFYLAYRLGSVICDRRFGMYFAVFLALPTWAAFELMFLTHVAVVESAILATLLITVWAARTPGANRIFLLGLAFGLGLHAHPTYLVVVLPMALLWHQSGGGFVMRYLAAATAGILLPFIPVLWAAWTGGGTVVGGISGYLASDLGAIGLWEVPVTLYSLLVNGVRVSFGTVFDALPATGLMTLYLVVLFAILVGGVLGWRHSSPPQRRLLAMTLLVLVGSVVLIALMRARTPWYMTFALMPALAACLACALRLGIETPRLRWLGAAVCTGVILLSAAWTWGFSRQVYDGQVLRLPAGSLHDVNVLAFEWERTAPAVGAWRSAAFGDFLCSERRVELLGAVGTAVDDRVGLDALLACGRRDHVAIGGCSADTTVSLPLPAWEALGVDPARTIAGTGLAAKGQFQCLQGGHALPVATGDVYPFRGNLGDGTMHEQTFRFTLPPGQALIIINQFSFLNWMDRLAVHANGAPGRTAWADATTRVYTCDECPDPVDWTISYRVQSPAQVYVLGLATGLSR